MRKGSFKRLATKKLSQGPNGEIKPPKFLVAPTHDEVEKIIKSLVFEKYGIDQPVSDDEDEDHHN